MLSSSSLVAALVGAVIPGPGAWLLATLVSTTLSVSSAEADAGACMHYVSLITLSCLTPRPMTILALGAVRAARFYPTVLPTRPSTQCLASRMAGRGRTPLAVDNSPTVAYTVSLNSSIVKLASTSATVAVTLTPTMTGASCGQSVSRCRTVDRLPSPTCRPLPFPFVVVTIKTGPPRVEDMDRRTRPPTTRAGREARRCTRIRSRMPSSFTELTRSVRQNVIRGVPLPAIRPFPLRRGMGG